MKRLLKRRRQTFSDRPASPATERRATSVPSGRGSEGRLRADQPFDPDAEIERRLSELAPGCIDTCDLDIARDRARAET
nr:hypothetical protein [Gammaproteobacteria bacterium]